MLAAATGRIRWALSHISVAVSGACLLLVAAGLAGLWRRDVGDLGPTGLVRPLVDGLADYIRESNEISQQAAPGTTQPPMQPSPSTPPGPPAQPG